MSFYKVSALSVLAISLAACSSSGDKTDSQPATTIPSATTGTAGNTNTGSTTNTGNTGTTAPTTPAPTTPTTPVTQPTVLVPAPTTPTGKALEAANKAKMLKIPQIKGKDIIRPAVFDGRTGYYTAKDKYVSSGELAINSTDFKRGLDARSRSYVILQGERLENYHVEGSERVYNQPYSIVYGNYYTRAVRDRDGKIWGLTNYTNGGANGYGTNLITKDQNYAYFNVDQIAGQATPASEIPTIGKATYGGGAFTGTGEGGLSYTVDFGKRTGSGSLYVSDIAGTVVLHEGEIVSTTGGGVAEKGIKGVASLADTQYKGNYELGFYGPNAAEIAGKATMTAESYLIKAPSNTLGSVIIGFGGTRGTITK